MRAARTAPQSLNDEKTEDLAQDARAIIGLEQELKGAQGADQSQRFLRKRRSLPCFGTEHRLWFYSSPWCSSLLFVGVLNQGM